MSAGTSSKRAGTGPSRRRYSPRRKSPSRKALWVGLKNCLRPRMNTKRPSEPRRRVRSVSALRSKRLAEYAAEKLRYLQGIRHAVTADGRIVAVCDSCRRWTAVDVHHTRGRAGQLLVRSQHWLLVCRACHDQIHREPEWARRRGLLAEKGDWAKS